MKQREWDIAEIDAVLSFVREKKFNQIPRKSIELAKLQRSRLSSEKLYLLVEEKFNETAIKEKSQFATNGNVNIKPCNAESCWLWGHTVNIE